MVMSWCGCQCVGGGALCEKGPGAALCQTQSPPASSARDPPQDTARPTSQDGGTVGNIFKGKKHWGGRTREKGDGRRKEQQGWGGRRCSTPEQVGAQGGCGPRRAHARGQEKSEQQGAVEGNGRTLTSSSRGTHCLAEGTERSRREEMSGGKV